VEQRVTVITLGVADLSRARAFYEALGWTTRAAPDDDVVFFQAGGMVISLWDQDSLAEDSGTAIGQGFGRITLAHNVASPPAVDAVLEEAAVAGARITRAGGATFWGGYSGVFADPDGHHWEVAHNPHWTLAPDGTVALAP
jgi:predicted lactoylglutathione lyase